MKSSSNRHDRALSHSQEGVRRDHGGRELRVRALAGPGGDRLALLNASTSEPVAEIGTAPIDMIPVLDHARSVGGPALRELTFHERALMLKQLAPY